MSVVAAAASIPRMHMEEVEERLSVESFKSPAASLSRWELAGLPGILPATAGHPRSGHSSQPQAEQGRPPQAREQAATGIQASSRPHRQRHLEQAEELAGLRCLCVATPTSKLAHLRGQEWTGMAAEGPRIQACRQRIQGAVVDTRATAQAESSLSSGLSEETMRLQLWKDGQLFNVIEADPDWARENFPDCEVDEAPLPPPPATDQPQPLITMSKYQFRRRFTLDELVKFDNPQMFVEMTAQQKAIVNTLMRSFDAATEIDLNDSQLQYGLQLMVDWGLLTAERKQQILDPAWRAGA